MAIVVIGLGGNALLSPYGKQSFSKENRNIDRISKDVLKLCKKNYKIVITHGNGSQVGDEFARNEHSKKFMPKLPLYVINAETQAQIGTVIETALRNNLNDLNVKTGVVVILSHVLVDGKDKAFKRATKPIGPIYTKKELQNELKIDKFEYIKVGSGYRQVIASPRPRQILEEQSIKDQLEHNIVIACGGGGIPVVSDKGRLYGADAVIDKDLTTQLLANSIKADKMVLLTNARCLYKNYGATKPQPIKSTSAAELRATLDDFEEGTIRPKLEACIKFIENGGNEAYIGNIFELDHILAGKSGTRIT